MDYNKSELSFKAGFARVNITPPIGIPIWGYYVDRFADGVLDELEANAVAFSCKGVSVLLITIDHCGLVKEILDKIKEKISEKTNLPINAIFIHSTHTHNGPETLPSSTNPLVVEYRKSLCKKVVDVARFALEDMKPSRLGFAIGKAENIAFIRRYRMKDGTVKTNPGVNNPDILSPIGQVDERVNVVRIDREKAETIVIANFGNHPDTIGGNKISGDWPGFTRRYVEKAIDNTKCIFFNGAQGDVNHVNVFPKGGDLNGLFMDFDGCSRGYEHTKHLGRVVAGAVMQVYSKVEYIDVSQIKYVQKLIDIPSNKPNPEEMPLAHKYNDLHLAGRDNEIPYEAMMLTTVVADAARKVRLENAPDYFPLLFSAIKIGNIAFMGIPGEPFTPVGTGIKDTKGYKLIIPCCNTNAKEGYFPMIDSYQEGGYEALASNYKEGAAERIVEESRKILTEILKD